MIQLIPKDIVLTSGDTGYNLSLIHIFVENAGFGATYAVPIGKLMLEKYLKGEISEANKATEEYIMNAVILPNNAL